MTDPTHDPATTSPEREDPVGVVAVFAGFVGILFFGLLMALVTAILGAWAGQRARDAGRSMQQAYLALFMAMVDGVVWLVLHLAFEMPFWLG